MVLVNKQNIIEWINKGQFDKAKAEVQNAEVDLIALKGTIAAYEGNYQDSETHLLEAMKLKADDTDIIFNMAIVQQLLGNFERAIYYYEKLRGNSLETDNQVVIDEKIRECKNEIEMLKKPLVSIVLLAYNKLEYTKMCVESILKHTMHIDIELIAVNNGSSDGTHGYFNNLPHYVRALHLPVNLGVSGGFNAGMEITRGHYIACVCNDFIFTPNWLDNLLTCMDSDPRIGYVSPGANAISNYQKIHAEYSTIDEMEKFALEYNYSDPLKWEDRVRLMPCVLMIRREVYEKVGGYDERFYYGEFADDDISFRIRREGYRLVYCKDTFTHHFGSVTVGVDQQVNDSMNVSRQIFANKYGFDSWESCMMHLAMLDLLTLDDKVDSEYILGINGGCGSNALQLKNMLRSRGIKQITIHSYCSNVKYRQDIKTISDVVFYGELNNIINQLGEKQLYSYIILETSTDELKTYKSLLYELRYLLSSRGQIACRIKHEYIDDANTRDILDLFKAAGLEVRSVNRQRHIVENYDLLLVATLEGGE